MKSADSLLGYAATDDLAFQGLKPPGRGYFKTLKVLAFVLLAVLSIWVFQILTGLGVTGLTHPVGWGVYIINFVFWVGIAHSGTLISAILHLVRSKWRDAVCRPAEAMTVFAVLTAGLFPLIDLGRLWVFYYLLPYPSERQLWPNFDSPLVWDACAVLTYLTVSVIFFYVGMIPDLASARDRFEDSMGPDHPRTRLYRALSLGWAGAGSQWRHYDRGYLYFAALATPLVVSVHSVVSWDFAVSLLPGWHSTLFAPYFVAGAIHSGLAMVLTLTIPMRRLLGLKPIITDNHLEAVAKTMLVTTVIVAYAYLIEPYIAWYSGNRFEQQFAWWRMTGWMAPTYWMLTVLNVLVPLSFFFRRVRRNVPALFTISILVNIGMWLERYFIVVGSTSHDFMPHNWAPYHISLVEISISLGAFCFFFFWFLLFARLLPTVATSELKELLAEQQEHRHQLPIPVQRHCRIARSRSGILGIFSQPDALLDGVRRFNGSPFNRVEVFSPVKIGEVDRILGLPHGPVRYWTLTGAVLGCLGGFALAIGTAQVNSLITGGKHPVSLIPYCVTAFEGAILLGTLANLAGLIVHARLGRRALPSAYDRRFSRDRFGLLVACNPGDYEAVKREMVEALAEEVHTLE